MKKIIYIILCGILILSGCSEQASACDGVIGNNVPDTVHSDNFLFQDGKEAVR